MRVGDQTGNGSQDCEWLDLQMGSVHVDLVLVDRDVAVVFFIDIQVLDNTARESVIEVHGAFAK